MLHVVEQAGGQCLPCVVDIRYEDQVARAVKQAVEKFGGIDILVNNAGAISLTDTLNTTMKKCVMSYIMHMLPYCKYVGCNVVIILTVPLLFRYVQGFMQSCLAIYVNPTDLI